MFSMIAKLAELLAKFGQSLVAYRRAAKDVDVAAAMLRCAVALQELCVRGEQLLTIAGELVAGTTLSGAAAEFADLVEQQITAIESVRSILLEAQTLLVTVDAGIYLDLVPFLDKKSGLLTRWSQQAVTGVLSTTTLFFLPTETLDRVIAIGKVHATPNGLTGDRSDYIMAVADGIMSAQTHEVRDLSRVVAARVPVVRQEIETARADLVRAKDSCGRLLAATKEAVGLEVMAQLRRTLLA
jgi:hypothetical protein